jgi:two-component system sensor histidine kinase BarA
MAYYTISSQRAEYLSNLQDTGRIAVYQIAENAAFALYSGDRESLDSLSYVVLEIPSVTGVLFYHHRDDQIITIGDIDFGADLLSENLKRESPFYFDSHWYFYSQIVSDPAPIMDYDEVVQYEPEQIGWVLLSLTDKILLQKERSFVLTTAIVVSLGLLLAFWLSIRIGRTVSEPLQKLTEVVVDMEAGNLHRVAPEKGTVELGKLARGINELATTIRQSNMLMQNEITRATSQLKDTLVELESAMKAKDQFLARMSHELRTPLTAVLGFSNILFTEDSEAKRQQHLQVIQRCSNVLLTMIDDILDFSKAELGGFSLKKSDFELDKLIDDLDTLFRTQAQEKGLEFEIVIEDKVPEKVHGDAVRLAQVLTNTVNNAIKFTDTGSVNLTISQVSFEDDQCTLEFKVADSGKGIAKDKIPILFEPFTQEDTSINRRFGGSGLGLTIAKRLVQAMGGDISINSDVDVGTTVFFTCKFNQYGYHDNQDSSEFEAAGQARSKTILSGLTILLAEDNSFNQQFLLRLLEGYGAVCQIAKDGLEAIYKVKNNHIDVILMDLHMPVVDGLLATKTIILQNVDSPPIIGLTADITESEQQKLIEAGAVDVQLKPVDEVKLVNAILAALNDKRQISYSSSQGMLSSFFPAEELKVVIYENLDNLEEAFKNNDKKRVKLIMHDLTGLSGLYGISELSELIFDLKNCFLNLNEEQNVSKVKSIRRYIDKSKLFD